MQTATITRDELIAGTVSCPGIQSWEWPRKSDKVENRCPRCSSNKVARIGRQWDCRSCNTENVTPLRVVVAKAGSTVRLQGRYPLNGRTGTKNWSPAGGFAFNAATRADAEAIRVANGLLTVAKMSESGTDDLRAVPRMVPIFLVTTWWADGVEYRVTD